MILRDYRVGKPAHFSVSIRGLKNGYLRCHHIGGGRMDFVRGLVGFVLLFSVHSVFAASQWKLTANGAQQPGFYSSAVLACNKAIELLGVDVNLGPSITGTAPARNAECRGQRTGFSAGVYGFATESCAPGSTFNSASQTCEEPNNCPPAGTVEGDSSNAYEASSINPSICIGSGTSGCVWKPGGTVPAVCANGKCYQWGPFTSTGAMCDPSSTAPGAPQSAASAPPEATNCVSKGQCPGTVNGTSVCVPCSSKSQESVTSSASAASSAASGAASPTTSGESGTSKTKTECSGSQCTTTTTTSTQKSDGSTEQKTSTKTEPMTDFCVSNPKAAVCKGEDVSQWGGACAGGFTCEGDAVQCAQAQAAYDLSCAIKTDPQNSTVQAGASALGAGDQPGDHPGNSAETVSFQLSQQLDSVPLFGSSASCPADVSFSAMGHPMAIPFSGLCPYLRMLGAALMACSYLAAAFIVFRD